MKSAIAILLVACLLSVEVDSAPARSEDFAARLPWPAGWTQIAISADRWGLCASLTRSLTPWLEIGATIRPADPFDLQAKVVLIRDLQPLYVAAAVSTRRASVLSTLSLGPVELDGGRTWGSSPMQWGRLRLSAHPLLSLSVGIEERAGQSAPVLGACGVFAHLPHWRWAISVRPEGLRLELRGLR